MPAMPPPTTSVAGLMSTVIGWSGSLRRTRSTPPARMALALTVAAALSVWTQESCSRIETSSHRYGLSPPRAVAVRNVFSWRCGEQAATTMRLRPRFLMSSVTSSWPGLEHMNL